MATSGSPFSTLVRRYAWWVLPSLAVAVALGLTIGYLVGFVVYAIINDIGVWLAIDHRFGPRGRRAWLGWVAMTLLPIGFIAVFLSAPEDGLSPGERVSVGSPDERVRGASAAGSVVTPPGMSTP